MTHTAFSAKFPPPKPKHIDRRTRQSPTPAEVTQLMQAARHVGRHGHRDTTLILLMYRHGLRVSEVTSLRWDAIDLKTALLHVRRLKHGVAATHPLHGPELRALRKLQHASPDLTYVFLSERGSPLSDRTIRHIILPACGSRRPAPVSGPSAYAPPCVWLFPGKQRHRYARHSAVPRASPYSAH